MPHRRGGSMYWCYVTVDGESRDIQTGATARALAKACEGTRDRLAVSATGDPIWMRAVRDGRTTLLDLYMAEQAKTLPQLRAKLDDVDLAPFLDDFVRHVPTRGKASPETVAWYRGLIERFAVDGTIMRSRFEPGTINTWLSTLIGEKGGPLTSGTRRHYYHALRAFAKYLKQTPEPDRPERMILTGPNPLLDVEAPIANAGREIWYPVPDLVRLIECVPAKYRGVVALIQGTGAERSAIWHEGKYGCKILVRHIDPAEQSVVLYGTKNAAKFGWRIRPVVIDDFAWPYVAAALKGRTPRATAFDASYACTKDVFYAARRAAGLLDYTMHDARHSYAVRWVKAGRDYGLIGGALGHRDGSMVSRRYGRYRVTVADYQRVTERPSLEEGRR